jgi:hypothetical protein
MSKWIIGDITLNINPVEESDTIELTRVTSITLNAVARSKYLYNKNQRRFRVALWDSSPSDVILRKPILKSYNSITNYSILNRLYMAYGNNIDILDNNLNIVQTKQITQVTSILNLCDAYPNNKLYILGTDSAGYLLLTCDLDLNVLQTQSITLNDVILGGIGYDYNTGGILILDKRGRIYLMINSSLSTVYTTDDFADNFSTGKTPYIAMKQDGSDSFVWYFDADRHTLVQIDYLNQIIINEVDISPTLDVLDICFDRTSGYFYILNNGLLLKYYWNTVNEKLYKLKLLFANGSPVSVVNEKEIRQTLMIKSLNIEHVKSDKNQPLYYLEFNGLLL